MPHNASRDAKHLRQSGKELVQTFPTWGGVAGILRIQRRLDEQLVNLQAAVNQSLVQFVLDEAF